MIDEEGAMTATHYSLLAALVFAIVAVLQFLRAAVGLPITIGRTSIPMWASWVACGVAIILAWLGYAASQG
jgi:protein-S-isoprenylcysteine O-methyltransferase Ste14